MTKNLKIKSLIQKQLVILDGATGTELQKRGLPAGVCPEIWCLENPTVIQDIHSSYAKAGARVVYTCTFGANRFKLKQFGVKKDACSVNRELARLARQACGKKALVAGTSDRPACLSSLSVRWPLKKPWTRLKNRRAA